MAGKGVLSQGKFNAIRGLRSLGLLPAADRCRFCIRRAQTWHRNRRFVRGNPGFATPPMHLAFDAFNHFDWFEYREGGLRHASVFAKIILQTIPAGALDILEWGCGPGRLIRHMPSLLAERAVRLTGADYNPESIAWCRANLPNMDFVENQLKPPLPLPDGRFDVVYNFSVFTHLSEEAQLAWAAELPRVLKPGGLFICTTHGDNCSHLLASAKELSSYNAGNVVIQGNYAEGKKWFFAIHPPRFVRDVLLKDLVNVQRINPSESDGIQQDVWVGTKKS